MAFGTSAAAQAMTSLDPLQIERLVRDYQIGELIRYWPATNGIENSNYFLSTFAAEHGGSEREYVLTILEQPSNAESAFVPLLDACVAAGLPVPAVLRNRQGAPYSDLDGKPAMICPRLPGRHVYNPMLRQVQALGRFIARFHLATASAGLRLPEYPRNLQWLERNAAACQGRTGYGVQALMTDVRLELASALTRSDVADLPRGPIHADLFRDNVLFTDRGLAGVLDFHHASEGWLIYDLAVAANDWCTDATGTLDPERTLALLRAYHKIRPLQRAELWYFPIFALYGALAFWSSRLVVALRKRQGAAVRSNDPDEFQRIVEQHHRHFFYLDERRLGA